MSREATFSLGARADNDADPDEILIVGVRDAGGGAVVLFPVTIQEPSASLPIVQFDALKSTHAEDTATLTIPVSVTPVSSSPISVGYTLAGTAARGADYNISGVTSNTGTLTIPANATSANLTISFTDDSLLEGREFIEIVLKSGTGYAAGFMRDHEVAVTDSEKGLVLSKTSLTLTEPGTDDPSSGDYTVALSQAPTGLVKVTVGKSAGSDLTVEAHGTDTRAPPGEMWFEADDYFYPQRVTATAGHDVDSSDDLDSLTNSASGGGYGGITGTVSVTTLDSDATPVDVTMSASDGDADGNAVEGASDTTGYRTITFTLSRALAGTEEIVVPLAVKGATAGTDYTLALSPSTQAGVALVSSDSRNANGPTLYIGAPASSATLRLAPIGNSDRTQPYVVIDYSTVIQVHGLFPTPLGTVSGGPIGVTLVDDESGDIAVPASWGLVPSGLSVGDDFRLLFRTSTGRDAASGDIAAYDAFVRGVLATGGHADVLPYAGFFKVFGSTRSGSGSSGTTARVHNGMATDHGQHVPSNGWTDGSAASSVGDASVGTPIYWLNGDILANNYADLCDQALKGGSGVVTGWDRTDPRSEDGTQNNPNSPGQAQQAWTGTGNACEAYDFPLGNSPNVSRGASHETAWAFMHEDHSPRTEQRPLYGMSPVFSIVGATVTLGAPLAGDVKPVYEVPEGDSVDVDVVLSNALSAAVTISIELDIENGAEAGDDYTAGPWSVTIPAGATSATFSVSTIDDNILEHDESIDIAIDEGSLPSSVIAAGQAVARVAIVDDEYTFAPGFANFVVDERIGDVPTIWVLSQPLTHDLDVYFQFTGLLATAGADFTPVHDSSSTALTIPAGETRLLLRVPIIADSDTSEPNELVRVHPLGINLPTNQHPQSVDITILQPDVSDSDEPVHLTISGATAPAALLPPGSGNSVPEGGRVTVTATVPTAPSGSSVTVPVALVERPSGATSHASADDVVLGGSPAGTIVIPDGQTSASITLTALADGGAAEGGGLMEWLFLEADTDGLSSGYRPGRRADILIEDTAAVPVALSVGNSGAVTEGDGALTITATLPTANGTGSAVAIPIEVRALGTTAQAGDYTLGANSITVANGATSGTTAFAVVDDSTPETDETVFIRLGASLPAGFGAGSPPVIEIVISDDGDTGAPPTASFASASYGVGEAGGSRNVPVNLSRAAPSGGLTVSYATGGTADSGDDYSGAGGSVTVAQGQTSANIVFSVVDDVLFEGDETLTLTLTDGAGYDLGSIPVSTVTINDNDAAPSGIALSVDDNSVNEADGATTITVTATVSGSTRFADPKTVAVSVAGSGAANVVGHTASPSTFSLPIAAGARTGTGTFTLTPTDNLVDENNETVTVSGTLSGVTVSPATITLADDDSAVATPVTVTLSAPAGDVTEGAAGAAGRKDVTITLGRVLTGSETVTVPLSVQGATVSSDYSFGLQPASQSGVSLLTGGSHSAQNPAVRFTAGATTAVLRFSPVNNADRTQPYVVIGYGTGARAPSGGGGVTLGTATGGPVAFAVVDDETGDIVVPASWGLAPSGLGAGDDFRLLFRSSTTRNAASSDIADYDAFIRDVAATMGHADVLPYAGFFQVFGSTRSSSGSTGTTARVHTGMAAEHTQHVPSGGWTDGSAAASVGDASVGVPIYWLNGDILANNYADLCDQAMSSGNGVTTGWGITDPRSEDGTQNNPNSPGQAQQAWTGTGNACEAYDYPLGNSPNVSRGSSHETNWAFMHQGDSPRAEQRPLYGMSPVFKIAGTVALPVADFAAASSSAAESVGTRNITVNLVPAPAQSVTVSYTLSGSAARGSDYTISGVTSNSGTVAVGTSGTAVIPVSITDDSAVETAETVVLTITGGGSDYTVGATAPAHTLTITDNDVTASTPRVRFNSPAISVPEHRPGIYPTVYLDPWPSSDLTINFAIDTNASTATLNEDYRLYRQLRDPDRDGVYHGTFIAKADNFRRWAKLSVQFIDDRVRERDETIVIHLLEGPGYTLGDIRTDIITITDDEQGPLPPPPPPPTTPVVTVTGGSAVHEGSGAAFTISASPAPSGSIDVRYTVSQNGQFAASGQLGSGKTQPLSGASATFTVPTVGDSADEADGSVTVTLDSGQGYTIGAARSASVTVRDDDVPSAEFAAAAASAPENGGTRNVRVNLSPAPHRSITLAYSAVGTATRGTDYTVSASVAVSAGATFVDIPVSLIDDNAIENSETVLLTLRAGSGYVLGARPAHTLTITDDDGIGLPVVTIAGGSPVHEGGAASFVISANPAPSGAISVRYTVSQNGQFVASGQLGSGKTRSLSGASVTFTVPTQNDSADEADGSVTVSLNNGTGYRLDAPASATVTVRDDDVPSVQFASAAASAAESAGTRNVRVNLSPAPHRSITLAYTVGGTATRGSDYTVSGSAAVSAGATFVDIGVVLADDSAAEPDETVVLTLSDGNGYSVGSRGVFTLTVTDDDVAPGTPTAAFASAAESVSESVGTHSVTLHVLPAPTSPVTVRYTVGGSAGPASDYTAPGGTVSVSAYTSSVTIDIPITDDTANEGDETVVLTLSAPGGSAGYVLGGQSSYTLTILDDDATPTTPRVRFNSPAIRVPEHQRAIYPTVYLDPWPSSDVTIHFAIDTNASTATLNEDYRLYRQLRDPDGDGVYHGTFVADAGNFRRWAKLSVLFIDDGVREGDETVVIRLLNGPGYSLGDMPTDTITITITD